MTSPPPLFPRSGKKYLPLLKAGEDRPGLESRLRILVKAVEQSPVSIIVTDNQGRIRYVNPKFCKVTGYSEDEVLGRTPSLLKSGAHPEEFYRDLWRTILAGEEWHGVFQNRTKDGAMLWELASISPIRDEDGSITHFVGVKEDFTEIKRLHDRMDDLAHHDQLTGLPNRTLFYDRLRQAQAQGKRRDRGFALFYLDLDGFKAVNDRHGHELGDCLLKAAGERISECVRESDTVARIGGDEFTVLLPDLETRESAAQVARLVVEALIQPFQFGAVRCSIGVSIGISFFPADGEDTDQLLARADGAMYRMKKAGGNRFGFWI